MEPNTYSSELYHHGVIGMKWGVRRYQNKDGSLINKKRIISSSAEGRKPAAKKKTKAKTKTSSVSKTAKPKKKRLSEMTDAEINERLERMALEKNYRDAQKEAAEAAQSRGQKFAMKCLESIGEKVITNIGTQVGNHFFGEGINRLAGVASDDVNNRIVNPQKGQSDKK